MAFCVVCFLYKVYRPQQIDQEQQHPLPLDLATELEDARKFTLCSLTTFLAVLAVSGSKALQPVTLTLLIHTISLRLAINTCFIQNFPTLSKFLHVLPLLGTVCMAGVELVSCIQSRALATVGISLGVLPLVAIVAHHREQCAEAPAAL